MTTDNPETKMVEVAQPTKMAVIPAEKEVSKRPLRLRFMDLSVDIKTLIVSHVRLRLVQLQETLQLHTSFLAAVYPGLIIVRSIAQPNSRISASPALRCTKSPSGNCITK